MSKNINNHKTESDNIKTAGSLALSPAVAVGLFLNTAFIHLALEILSSSEKVKARDPRTLLNVYKDAVGHVPTQILGYLNSFYENLWENWGKSAENAFGKIPEGIDKEIRNYFKVPAERDIYKEIIETWGECLKTPGSDPSPVNAQSITSNSLDQQSVGVF